MKISVISPVKNEAQLIGYSIMAVHEYVHEFVYLVDPPFEDGTWELLHHIKDKYVGDKLRIYEDTDSGSHEMTNISVNSRCFDFCIEKATGDAVWQLHPDMIVTNPQAIANVPEGPLAWWCNCRSFAKTIDNEIVFGRSKVWRNIYAKKFGLHYYGEYGGNLEDFYFRDITGNAYKHYQNDYSKYPYESKYSGINFNHYCEMKPYSVRYKKMTKCLKTQVPQWTDKFCGDMAMVHPRVTLEDSTSIMGQFKFEKIQEPVPPVFNKYKDEFNKFIKTPLYV